MLAEADADHDGLMTDEQWNSVELWFQYRKFQPGVSEADLKAAYAEMDEPERQAQFERYALAVHDSSQVHKW